MPLGTVLTLLSLRQTGKAELPPLIPKPNLVERREGFFRMTAATRLVTNGAGRDAATLLSRVTKLGRVVSDGPTAGTITFLIDPGASTSPEGYTVDVDAQRVLVKSPTAAGLLWGAQTLRQLIAAKVENFKSPQFWGIPGCHIEDSPRFAWRGLMLDVSRHFFTVSEVKRYLDLMSLHKLNVFHWHLTDDGGWRIEIKKYPELTNTGAYRVPFEPWDMRKLRFPGRDQGATYGGYYKQSEIKEIVRYASSLGITVVPEIDLPGHAMAAIASYPELACRQMDMPAWIKATGLLTPNVVCAGRESTAKFCTNVLLEVMSLFPGKVIHLGGDEVNTWSWQRCLDCQGTLKERGLRDSTDLQGLLVKRLSAVAASQGKQVIAWDEVLETAAPKDVAVMSWRGEQRTVKAAREGRLVVASPTDPCYFDYVYEANPVESVYAFEPVPAALRGTADAERVSGGQANLWTEWILDFAKVERMAFPRAVALSEALWSTNRNWDDFSDRLGQYWPRLDALEVQTKLPQPQPQANLCFIDLGKQVQFAPSPIPGLTLRYTLDGSRPTIKSSEFPGPILPIKPCTIRAAYFDTRGRMSDDARVECLVQPRVNLPKFTQGIDILVYEGEGLPIENVPTFTPSYGTIASLIQAEDVPSKGKPFMARYDGFLNIPKQGMYTFQMKCWMPFRVKLGGANLIVGDGEMGVQASRGKVWLKPGLIRFSVLAESMNRRAQFTLTVSGPDLPEGPIPASWIYRRKL
jgi:hexosaminidase